MQLKVSAGAQAIPVPDVIGSQVDQARQLLTADGFTVREEQVVDEEAPVGEVVDQDPGPNEEAPRGSEVTIFVSKGPADRPVPDVVGRTITEASNLLGQAGFAVNQTSEPSDTVEEGLVIRTDPPADTVRPKGSAVVVVVSTGPREVEVISVVDLSRDSARNTLETQGLVVQDGEFDPACSDIRVDGQDPPGGTTARVGSTVTLTYRCDDPVDGVDGGG